MKPLKTHLFVCTSCTYTKEDSAESDPEEAVILRKNLKNRVRACLPKNEARVSASTCLGQCESGIAAVLYPEGHWKLGLRASDEDELFNMVMEGHKSNN